MRGSRYWSFLVIELSLCQLTHSQREPSFFLTFVSFALAKHVKIVMVFGGDLIMEGFEFLKIKGF